MQTPEIDLLSGQTVRTYELKKVIGVGGFGVVYQAYQHVVERDVAIKVILPQFADHPDFIRHFESEAHIIAQLEHPYIVPLYDFWREPGGAYLVMRWLRGGSLRDLIIKSGTLDLVTIARILDQITEALTVAHQKGIIHQDIKPENILLDEHKNAYLTDFGIAKGPFGFESTLVEETGFGTAAYASPDQIMSSPVTPQTDIYNLGIMLYELLTGRVPFASESDSTVIYKQLHEPVPLVRRLDVPDEVNNIIGRATAKKPEKRYPDAIILASEFNRAIQRGAPIKPTVLATDFLRPAADRESPAATKALFELGSANPYKGLQSFSEADQADFFGRDDLIEQLLDRLRLSKIGSRLLAVVGPSGSGKSSVVQAGVIPHLRRGAIEDSNRWFITQMNPGPSPFKELEAALVRISRRKISDLSTQIRQLDGGLLRALRLILPEEKMEFVLLIDQFEEIFILCESETERALFLDCLFQAVNDAQSCLRVIITLRADFYDRPLMYAGIGEMLRNNTEVVLPLSVDGLMQAIARPAERYGLQLEPGLLSVIVEDVHRQPSSLPLLQHALTELHNRREGRLLTKGAYYSSGGVVGALAHRAEEIYEALDSNSQLIARQVFLHLVASDENSKNSSRRVLHADLMFDEADKLIVSNVLDAFRKYSLLTFDHDPTTRSPTVQIAHDALIQVWERLRDWINSNREDLRLRQSLTAVCHEWLNSNREPSFLATGSRLAQFEALLESNTLILSEDEKQYLNASAAFRQRAINRLRLLIVVFAIFSIISLSLAMIALDRQSVAVAERDRADQEAQISRSRELAVLALTNGDQADLSLLLSLEALRSFNTFEARNSLLTALQSTPHLISFLHGHTDGVRAIDFSPEGDLLASGGRDNIVIIWNIASGQISGSVFTGHTGWINALDFSPDGRLLASASEDGSVLLWDVATGEAVGQPMLGHTGAVRSVVFSPDGRLLASASEDGSVLLWDVATGNTLGEPLSGHTNAVWSVAFSPDGKQLATGSADQTIRLWDVESQMQIGNPFTGHSNWVLSIAFSPVSRILASGGADNMIVLWNIDDHVPIGQPLTGHQDWVRSVAFSPDGEHLVSGSADQTVRLWNLLDLSQVTLEDIYQGHTDAVLGVAFAANGHSIASASADRKVILWDTKSIVGFARSLIGSGEPVLTIAIDPSRDSLASAGGNRIDAAKISLWDLNGGTLREVLQTPSNLVTSLTFNPNDSTLASASFDGVIRLWETESGSLQKEFFIPGSSTIYGVAFSPDGRMLAVATDRPDITLWDVASGTQVGSLVGHNDSVYTVAFSPDGKLLASGGREDTVQLWDLATLQPKGEALTGHDDNVMSIAFSPDGRLLASGSRDYTVRVWDVSSLQLYREPFEGHADWVTSVTFSADNQLLASGSQDDTVRLWDISSGQAFGLPFEEHQGWVNSVLFNSNRNLLVSGGQDATIVLREISLPALQELACKTVNRNLTEAEWKSYFPNRVFHETCAQITIQ